MNRKILSIIICLVFSACIFQNEDSEDIDENIIAKDIDTVAVLEDEVFELSDYLDSLDQVELNIPEGSCVEFGLKNYTKDMSYASTAFFSFQLHRRDSEMFLVSLSDYSSQRVGRYSLKDVSDLLETTSQFVQQGGRLTEVISFFDSLGSHEFQDTSLSIRHQIEIKYTASGLGVRESAKDYYLTFNCQEVLRKVMAQGLDSDSEISSNYLPQYYRTVQENGIISINDTITLEVDSLLREVNHHFGYGYAKNDWHPSSYGHTTNANGYLTFSHFDVDYFVLNEKHSDLFSTISLKSYWVYDNDLNLIAYVQDDFKINFEDRETKYLPLDESLRQAISKHISDN